MLYNTCAELSLQLAKTGGILVFFSYKNYNVTDMQVNSVSSSVFSCMTSDMSSGFNKQLIIP